MRVSIAIILLLLSAIACASPPPATPIPTDTPVPTPAAPLTLEEFEAATQNIQAISTEALDLSKELSSLFEIAALGNPVWRRNAREAANGLIEFQGEIEALNLHPEMKDLEDTTLIEMEHWGNVGAVSLEALQVLEEGGAVEYFNGAINSTDEDFLQVVNNIKLRIQLTEELRNRLEAEGR